MEKELSFIKKLWKKIKIPFGYTASTSVFLLIILMSFNHFVLGMHFSDWTGFYLYPSTSGKMVTRTLWDLLELLIIPFVLAIAAFLFNKSEREKEQFNSQEQRRDNVLQTYFDNISDLILNHKLYDSEKENKVRMIALIRTTSALQLLDSNRIETLLRFLREAKLTKIIDFSKTDLRKVDLKGVNLDGFILNETQLQGANLSGSSLYGASMIKANISGSSTAGTIVGQDQLKNMISDDVDISNIIFYSPESPIDYRNFLVGNSYHVSSPSQNEMNNFHSFEFDPTNSSAIPISPTKPDPEPPEKTDPPPAEDTEEKK